MARNVAQKYTTKKAHYYWIKNVMCVCVYIALETNLLLLRITIFVDLVYDPNSQCLSHDDRRGVREGFEISAKWQPKEGEGEGERMYVRQNKAEKKETQLSTYN